MSFLDTLTNLFKKSIPGLTESQIREQKGYTAFQCGDDLYAQNEIESALQHFDTASDCGFERASLFSMRGGCLQSLGFDLDAIDDFTRAIELDAEDSNNYFMRSLSKRAVGDLQGCVNDLNEAIRLACIDSSSTRSYKAYALENGYKDGIVGMYRMEIMHANLDLERQAFDEHRLQGQAASLGPDLVTKRRSEARRRIRQ